MRMQISYQYNALNNLLVSSFAHCRATSGA